MKKLLISFICLLFLLIACTPNARPFEMLLGVAPLGEVDLINLEQVNYNPEVMISDLPYEYRLDEADLAYDPASNVLILVTPEVAFAYILDTNKAIVRTNDFPETDLRDYRGVTFSSDSMLLGRNTEYGSYELVEYDISYETNNNNEDTYRYGDNQYYFNNFQMKHISMDRANNRLWSVRLHNPIEKDNTYPGYNEGQKIEFIRAYKLQDQNGLAEITFHSPGGECFGLEYAEDKLYALFLGYEEVDGGIDRIDGDKKFLYRINPKTLEFENRSSGGFSEMQALAYDGKYIWTIARESFNDPIKLYRIPLN